MCTRVLSFWHTLVKLYGSKEEVETCPCPIYDTSSESEVSITSRSSSRYNLRARKVVNYTEDADDEAYSVSRSPMSRRSSSRVASSNDD